MSPVSPWAPAGVEGEGGGRRHHAAGGTGAAPTGGRLPPPRPSLQAPPRPSYPAKPPPHWRTRHAGEAAGAGLARGALVALLWLLPLLVKLGGGGVACRCILRPRRACRGAGSGWCAVGCVDEAEGPWGNGAGSPRPAAATRHSRTHGGCRRPPAPARTRAERQRQQRGAQQCARPHGCDAARDRRDEGSCGGGEGGCSQHDTAPALCGAAPAPPAAPMNAAEFVGGAAAGGGRRAAGCRPGRALSARRQLLLGAGGRAPPAATLASGRRGDGGAPIGGAGRVCRLPPPRAS